MPYIENPKTKGSGIVCAIPQEGKCPNRCADCFFQSGRSYLEPLFQNLPNMPDPEWMGDRVVRVNDGNDSNVDREKVVFNTAVYRHRFFNTCIPKLNFSDPVVLTINPNEMTDMGWHCIAEPPKNLMFVRIRTNRWNVTSVVERAIAYYTGKGVPVVLTFMAYHDEGSIPERYRSDYEFRKRTTNSYWAITHHAWLDEMDWHLDRPLVHSCGTEGIEDGTLCKNCGNCLREYWATQERLGNV